MVTAKWDDEAQEAQEVAKKHVFKEGNRNLHRELDERIRYHHMYVQNPPQPKPHLLT